MSKVEPFNHELDLEKLVGIPVVKIYGQVTNEFGEPVFKLTRVVFADDSIAEVEGEHDLPYLSETPRQLTEAIEAEWEAEEEEDDE